MDGSVTGASSWPRGLVLEPAEQAIRAIEGTKAVAMATLTGAYVAVHEAGLVDAKLKELEARLDAKVDATSNGRAA